MLASILATYAGVAIVVAIRLGAYASRAFNRYDWTYGRAGIIRAFLGSIVLWPHLLANPRYFLTPAGLFASACREAACVRQCDQLLSNPPPCGRFVRYRPSGHWNERVTGEFLLCASAFEPLLRRAVLHAGDPRGIEAAVLNWVANRDDSSEIIFDIPLHWGKLSSQIELLLPHENTRVHCFACQEDFGPKRIRTDSERVGGWILKTLHCPAGHDLMVMEEAHLLVRPEPLRVPMTTRQLLETAKNVNRRRARVKRWGKSSGIPGKIKEQVSKNLEALAEHRRLQKAEMPKGTPKTMSKDRLPSESSSIEERLAELVKQGGRFTRIILPSKKL